MRIWREDKGYDKLLVVVTRRCHVRAELAQGYICNAQLSLHASADSGPKGPQSAVASAQNAAPDIKAPDVKAPVEAAQKVRVAGNRLSRSLVQQMHS